MRALIWSKAFTRSLKRWGRKRPDLQNAITEALRALAVDPFAPQLETHKLKGKLSGSWACSAGYDLRVVFDFVKTEKNGDDDILTIGDRNP